MTIASARRTHAWTEGDTSYDVGKYHFAASSEQDPACVVEPGTSEDVGKIVRLFPSSRSLSFVAPTELFSYSAQRDCCREGTLRST